MTSFDACSQSKRDSKRDGAPPCSHTSSTTRANGVLAIATQTAGDWPREARVVKTGGDKTRCWVQMLVTVRYMGRDGYTEKYSETLNE